LLVVRTRYIKMIMADRGFASQQALAAHIGMDTGQLNKYVNDKQTPGLSVINRLCKALECQPGDILEYRPG